MDMTHGSLYEIEQQMAECERKRAGVSVLALLDDDNEQDTPVEQNEGHPAPSTDSLKTDIAQMNKSLMAFGFSKLGDLYAPRGEA